MEVEMTVDELDRNMLNVMKYVGDRVSKQKLFGKNLFKAVETGQPELIDGYQAPSEKITSIRKELQNYLGQEGNLITDRKTQVKPSSKKQSLNLHS
jgi:hypothetical protein